MQCDHIAPRPAFRPSPEVIAGSQLTAFIGYCEQETGLSIRDSTALHEWAVREFREFWRCFLSWSRIDFEGSVNPLCVGDLCETATFFPGLRLSYVENLLRITSEKDEDRTALTCCHASGLVEKLSRYTLRVRVRTLAAKLHQLGIRPGDRVVAIAHNSSEAVIGALAATAVGAAFSSASPEMGAPAILSRFDQLFPKILMAHVVSAGQVEQSGLSEKIVEVARGLRSLDALIMLDEGPLSTDVGVASWRLSDILANRDEMSGDTLSWPRFPFNHPLFILFSSGTTGRPKCIVHGAGGTLLEHVKEHRLHGDIRSTDKLFFHTSTAWMMWNWQLSVLACGAEIVLFDGPVRDPETLWRLVSKHGVTVFGTSPSFLKLCEDAAYSPRRKLSLSALRAILSTGAVLHDRQYDWVQENVGSVPLQSISGGTDIIGCFVLGNPNLPVYRGESQCRSLGLDVRALEPAGTQSNATHFGELVCQNPFPSRPLGFYGDHDGAQFHKAYFQQNPGMWTHGDLIEFTPSEGARLHGRSDSILNVNGIRIGPAEIYQILQGFPEIQEAMAVEQKVPEQQDASRLVLLIVPRERGGVDNILRTEIRKRLASQASPAHVPARIVEVAELPVTYSGKRSERAVRDALNGTAGSNMEALRNPGCLEDICRQVDLEDQGLQSRHHSARVRVEEQLRAIWEHVLGFRDVDADDSFFDLGGTSIMVLRLCREINDRLGVTIEPWTLFYTPTLRALTLAIGTKGSALSSLVLQRQCPTRSAEIREYTKRDLKNVLAEERYWTQPRLPITKLRVISHISNPRSDDDDIVLITAFNNGCLVAHLGILPDLLRSEWQAPMKFGWLTGWWADKHRGGAAALMILFAAMKKYSNRIAISMFSPAAKGVIDATERFQEFARFDLTYFILALPSSWRVVSPLAKWISAAKNRMIFSGKLQRHGLEVRMVDSFDEALESFI
jgi:acetoacetyl-CoA synthetase